MSTIEPICQDEQRRADVLAQPDLNGIDFVEYEHSSRTLTVTLLKPVPADAYGLTPGQVIINGGSRIVGIRAVSVTALKGNLQIVVDQEGDFSDYELLLGWQRTEDGNFEHTVDQLDEQLSRTSINFKADCPVDFDCRAVAVCPPRPLEEPTLDYLAKDYASFRQLLLDRIVLLNPNWLERSPADLGMVLVELLAYEGDHLSYFQDAVANEAFLDTARQRVSAKRHARLIDYRMHDGRNAWTFVHLQVDSPGSIPQGTQLLTRLTAPLRHRSALPQTVLQADDVADDAFDRDPVLVTAAVFESAFDLQVDPENNAIVLHTWGNLDCCLPSGATSAEIYSVSTSGQAELPTLKAGNFLLLEEVKGPATGALADADPAHRQVVQLINVEVTQDGLFSNQLKDERLQRRQTADAPLPLLKVTWRDADALNFPLCLSARPPCGDVILNVSVARGNVVLADHGRTVQEVIALPQPIPTDRTFRLQLQQTPLTLQRHPDEIDFDAATGVVRTRRTDLTATARQAQPAVFLALDFPTGPELWQPVPDLLDSPPFAPHYVVDIDNRGDAELRFGDGEYGRIPAGATKATATYRIGNGRSGNIGSDALAHIVQPTVALGWPTILLVRNPLAARDGSDAETIEEVRQHAPAAFRAEQFRAVTEADYSAAALKLADVAGAVAAFRWTGSWYTVFVGIDPRRPEDLITLPGGRTRLAAAFADRVRAHLTHYKLAGYDLEIVSGQYVPLDIELKVCVLSEYFRGDVVEAVRRALSNRVNPDSSLGFFHPEHFTFGDPVYASRLYAAVEAVEGVDSLRIVRLRRYGKLDNGELQAGVVVMGAWEIARLDNDPNFMENGVLRIDPDGGK